MKVLIDMNLSPDWVGLLGRAGHEATHWSAVGPPAAGDDELIAWSAETGSVIITNDLDFGIALITRRLDRPSVIQLRSDDLRPAVLGMAVLGAIEAYAVELGQGALLTIDPARARIRLLRLGDEPQ